MTEARAAVANEDMQTDDGVTSEMRLCPVLFDTVCYMTLYGNKDEEPVMWKFMHYYIYSH